MVSGFHRARGVDRTHVGAAEGAIVGDVFDAGPSFGDGLAKRGEAAGTITDGHGKSTKPTIGHKAFFDHPTQDRRIDIAATHG